MDKLLLESYIRSRKLSIGIIGLGYVGLPLAYTFLKAGFNVLGFDIDKAKVNAVNQGKSYISTLSNEDLYPFIDQGMLEATTDFSLLSEPDAIIICVPTPLTKAREPDLSYIISSVNEVKSRLRKGQIVILESTTYPGTTNEVVLPLLEESELEVGKDFYLGFSPEREDPGNKSFNTATIPKIVSGITHNCKQVITILYEQAILKIVPVSSTRTAELTKLVENIYRCINIALVNELKVLCHKMDIDIHEVLDAAATKPFGFQKFSPGPGIGGHCIGLDPSYLSWKAREYDFYTRFIELAGQINTSMPYYVVQRLTEALNNKHKSLSDSHILVLGITYKKDIDDMRESPAIKIIELLLKKQAKVDYHDPFFDKIPTSRDHSLNLESVPLDKEHLEKVDCVLIVTDHSTIDYQMVLNHARLVVDSRNVMQGIPDPHSKIFLA